MEDATMKLDVEENNSKFQQTDKSTSQEDKMSDNISSTSDGIFYSEEEMELDSQAADSEVHRPYSERIQRMIEQRDQFLTEDEFQTAFSKEHWTELDPTSDSDRESGSEEDPRNLGVISEETEALLLSAFSQGLGKINLSRKLGEGAQAMVVTGEIGDDKHVALKIYKNRSLKSLLSQWPADLFNLHHPNVCRAISAGVGREEEGYAGYLTLEWHLFDLRSLMEDIMSYRGNEFPPFSEKEALRHMLSIACGMLYLHSKGILHKDLKASNVLMKVFFEDSPGAEYSTDRECSIADYECGVGVIGTGFWRAPEVLMALQEGGKPQMTFQTDVYSFGMTCYEILTGLMPFEGHKLIFDNKTMRNFVIQGKRPKLPGGLNPQIKQLVRRCWQSDPQRRPNFTEIVDELEELTVKLYGVSRESVRRWHHRAPMTTEEILKRHRRGPVVFFVHKGGDCMRTLGRDESLTGTLVETAHEPRQTRQLESTSDLFEDDKPNS